MSVRRWAWLLFFATSSAVTFAEGELSNARYRLRMTDTAVEISVANMPTPARSAQAR